MKKPRARAKAAPKKAPSSKTKPAPARAKPAAKAAKAPAPKKRRVRSQEDKALENAPMNEPFYVETGSEWHNTGVDAYLGTRFIAAVL